MSVEETSPLAMDAADPHGGASATEQLTLVRHLHTRLRDLFTGAAAEHRVITGRAPSKVLQVGVIPPLPLPDPDSGETAEELARRLRRAPSNIGLDFEVDPLAGGRARLALTAAFSAYVQCYPEFSDQQRFIRGEEQDTREEDDGSTVAAPAGSMRLAPVFERHRVESGAIDIELSGPEGEREVPLDRDISSQLGPVLRDSGTVYPFWGRSSQTLPADALGGTPSDFDRHIRAAEGGSRHAPLEPPRVTVRVSWRTGEDGRIRVQTSLCNDTQVRLRPDTHGRGRKTGQLRREMDLFDSDLQVRVAVGHLLQIPFRRAPEDFRYADVRRVWAVGRNCAAACEGEVLRCDHWPVHEQPRMGPRRGMTPGSTELALSFEELSKPDSCVLALGRVTTAMGQYVGMWQQRLADWPEESKDRCVDAMRDFEREVEAFQRGVACLNADPLLMEALCAANAVFERVGRARDIRAWHLFQVVYQIIHLAALRAREVPTEDLLCEIDTVDVLWFPTGGGKTEAYLGLIIAALFYDRLRGKQRGVTAMLRFPLRMLSVQQLQRIVVAVAAAERHRLGMLQDGRPVGGDPFALGYWAGGDNSPNSLSNDSEKAKPQEHIRWWASVCRQDDRGDSRRIITVCPDPGCSGEVKLKADMRAVRLRHVCSRCGQDAPLYVSDEEVYRYLPAVVVCTVDKLSQLARAEEYVNLLAGPAYRCPDHNYFTWHRAGDFGASGPRVRDRCGAGMLCRRAASEYEVVGETKDPTPAFIVQDELHLLEEELGTFSSHYDTLLATLQEELGGGPPSKILAATATIEAYESQVRDLYARGARAFPAPGWALGESFYVQTDRERVRRVYVGAAPNRPDITEFGGLAQRYLHEEVSRMQRDPGYGLRRLGLEGVRDEEWLQAQLRDYELTLGYVNRKRDGDRVADDLERERSQRTGGRLRLRTLVGGGGGSGTSLAEIADTLNEIETQYRDRPDEPASRLRALVATSVVSHGVDLNALNLMVVNNMTPTVAQYVQSSSRSGRTHVGLVIVGFNPRAARERAFFSAFREYHQFLDRMIAPVPVNRFARGAPRVTVPGLTCALIVHALGRQRLNGTLNPARPVTPLSVGREGRNFVVGANAATRQRLGELLERALGVHARARRRADGRVVGPLPVFPPRMTQWLQQEGDQLLHDQLQEVAIQAKRGSLARRFVPQALISFRAVDAQFSFRPDPSATGIFGALRNRSS